MQWKALAFAMACAWVTTHGADSSGSQTVCDAKTDNCAFDAEGVLPLGVQRRQVEYKLADDAPTKACGIENVRTPNLAPSDDPILKALDVCQLEAMSSCEQKRTVLGNLKRVLDAGVPGAIVELGCHEGSMSVWIRRLLDAVGASASREYHVYDSFQGVPTPTIEDGQLGLWHRGDLNVSRNMFRKTFVRQGLKLPIIHTGFFKDIRDREYPAQIAFAFLDGDLYESIIHSFAKVYPKLSPQAVALVHDYELSVLPGAATATKDFFKHRKENPEDCTNYVGRVIKL